MSEVLFSSLQFKFAQCHTWVMKKVVKHKQISKYILHSIDEKLIQLGATQFSIGSFESTTVAIHTHMYLC